MFEITFLGTGASAPSANRGLPALLVAFGACRVLVDCGEGTQRQLLASGLGFRGLRRIFLTHAHLDHVLGLAGLAATLGLFGTGAPLILYGGSRTLAYVRQYLYGVWGGDRGPVPVRFQPLVPGPVFEDRRVAVSCFPVPHAETDSFGFRFSVKPRRHLIAERCAALGVPAGPERASLAAGRTVMLADGRIVRPEDVSGPLEAGPSLAVVGDTSDTGPLAPHVAGADLLIIEATFRDGDRAIARTHGHITAGEAARLAHQAGVGRLVLNHLSGRYEAAEILAEARQHFAAAATAADFDRVSVP